MKVLLFIVFCSFSKASTQSTLSCQDRCQEAYDPSAACYCDYLCLSYENNCCDDYTDLCLPERNTSCSGRCYELPSNQAAAECSCGDTCSKDGTCCSDYIPKCASEIKCEGRCLAPHNSDYDCQCDNDCQSRKDCCKDFSQSCLAAPLTTTRAMETTTCSGRMTLLSPPLFLLSATYAAFSVK